MIRRGFKKNACKEKSGEETRRKKEKEIAVKKSRSTRAGLALFILAC